MQYQPALPPAPFTEAPAEQETNGRRVHRLLLLGLVASLGAFALLALPELLEQRAPSYGVAPGGSSCSAAAPTAPPAQAVPPPAQVTTSLPEAVTPAGDVTDKQAARRRQHTGRKSGAL